jgi:hypothetical protein
MKRFFLLSCLFVYVAALPLGYSFAQDDGDDTPQERHRADGKSCDNSFERKPDDRCACEHAEMCDPNDPKDKEKHDKMSAKCQWFCKPSMCHCGNACNS